MSPIRVLSQTGTSNTMSTSYILSSDTYVILALLAMIILAVGGTIIAESSIPLIRGHFVNNIGAVILSVIAVAIVWNYSGRTINIMGFQLKAVYVAYVAIIAVLMVAFSG